MPVGYFKDEAGGDVVEIMTRAFGHRAKALSGFKGEDDPLDDLSTEDRAKLLDCMSAALAALPEAGMAVVPVADVGKPIAKKLSSVRDEVWLDNGYVIAICGPEQEGRQRITRCILAMLTAAQEQNP